LKEEHFQESALTIIQFQHVNRYSLVLENFNFLPHMLQKQQDEVGRSWFFVVFKSILLFASTADAVVTAAAATAIIYSVNIDGWLKHG
jgi:hypothetical protein